MRVWCMCMCVFCFYVPWSFPVSDSKAKLCPFLMKQQALWWLTSLIIMLSFVPWEGVWQVRCVELMKAERAIRVTAAPSVWVSTCTVPSSAPPISDTHKSSIPELNLTFPCPLGILGFGPAPKHTKDRLKATLAHDPHMSTFISLPP